jgi:hypothetical protein
LENDNKNKNVRVIKASRMLQAKVGTGNVAAEIVEKSQKLIEENTVDFAPLAEGFIKELADNVRRARDNQMISSRSLESIISPIMQIKANAAMFDYPLAGSISSIVLNFLEDVKECDDDVLDVANVCQNILNLVIANKLSGEAGTNGEALQTELREACRRYLTKKQNKS